LIATRFQQFTESDYSGRRYTGLMLSQLLLTTADKVLTMMCLKPSPTDVLHSSVDVFAPDMRNLSFRACRFPAAFKTDQVLTAFVEEADIEPHDSFQHDRAAGAGQTEAPPACVIAC